MIDSAKYLFSYPIADTSYKNLLQPNLSYFKLNSEGHISRLKENNFSFKDSSTQINSLLQGSKKSSFQIEGGYVSYYVNYRSGIDTPFVENNISQHIISGSLNAMVANTIPIRITGFARQKGTIFTFYKI